MVGNLLPGGACMVENLRFDERETSKDATEVATDNHFGTPIAQPLQGGKKGTNAPVIGDGVAIEWHIGIHSEENSLTVKVSATQRSKTH